VLQQQGGRHRRIAGIHVDGCSLLGGIEKNFSEAAVGKATDRPYT
jgi:hypothetical protein